MVDLSLTDEIKALGVSKAKITKNYLYLYNGKFLVQSTFYRNNLEKALLELQDKMISSGHFGLSLKGTMKTFYLADFRH